MATSFQDRFIGALKLQASTYDDVEHDQQATSQAALVVLIASIAGALVWLRFGWMGMLIRQLVASLLAWAAGAAVIWLIGTRLLPGRNTQADYFQVLRPVGFAHAPGVFAVLAVMPFLGWLIGLAVAVWSLAALVVAVRAALDYDDVMKAIVVVLIAFVTFTIIRWALGSGYGYGLGWY